MAFTASVDVLSPAANSSIFLPFATISFDASLSSALASAFCSFLLAGTCSPIVILFAARNLAARIQLVHPLRW